MLSGGIFCPMDIDVVWRGIFRMGSTTLLFGHSCIRYSSKTNISLWIKGDWIDGTRLESLFFWNWNILFIPRSFWQVSRVLQDANFSLLIANHALLVRDEELS